VEQRTRPIKLGLTLPQIEGMMHGETARWADLLAMARRAEEVGFDSVWVVDHLLLHGVRQAGQLEGLWECWTLLAALAAATERVELGPLVSCTSFRNPALLAKMADTVDEISGGRLILGLGAGWHEYEYNAFGYPFDHRVGRFEEALTIIHALLREGKIDFQGKYYQARECELRPRGPRPTGPPILIGALANRPRVLDLMARYADQWNVWLVFGRSHADQIPPLREAVDAACAGAGRDPATLGRTAGVLVDVTGRTPPPKTLPSGSVEEPIAGSPEEIAEALRAFAREGIDHLQVRLYPNNLAGIEAFAPVIERLGRG
jgi:alkanesulfonate monooxygenase SsuD/methylene tetrahydromethanopterin reductase-like flavin-dependent oxidoreductase (luciferase family)